jgi:hypothetical protein
MIVKHLVEKPDGTVVFQGVLEGKELAFVIETGLDYLIEQGHIPFVSLEDYNVADLHGTPEQEQ